MPLRNFVQSWKSIATSVAWTPPDPDDSYIRFMVPLEIEGIVESGLFLTGGTYLNYPDQNVTFEISFRSNGTKPIWLARIDWRSLRGGHSNQRRKCRSVERRVRSTHIHTFEMNWIEETGQMKKGRLPCAENIEEDIQSFESLRQFSSAALKIKNIDVVPVPKWTYDLFTPPWKT
jgi:hypothetical protein